MDYMSGQIILSLDKAIDVYFVGGKAASLSKLIAGGFEVPPGFVITTRLENLQKSKDKILRAFDDLDSEKVAVRSSAVAEDSSNAAWAGQFDTFLNIERGHLVEAVSKCLDSSHSKRAEAYAKEKGLVSGKVAVIVQQMIPADYSGVAFSAHPVLENKDLMIVEAVPGLAEGLVSGTLTPDSYVLSRPGLELRDSTSSGIDPILKQDKLKRLASEVKKIETFFGFPVDVEWSFSKNKLFILQARPITTLG